MKGLSKLKLAEMFSEVPPMDSLEKVFCHIDDFCCHFEPPWRQMLLGYRVQRRERQRSMSLSKIMTILVSFHRESYSNFKHFY